MASAAQGGPAEDPVLPPRRATGDEGLNSSLELALVVLVGLVLGPVLISQGLSSWPPSKGDLRSVEGPISWPPVRLGQPGAEKLTFQLELDRGYSDIELDAPVETLDRVQATLTRRARYRLKARNRDQVLELYELTALGPEGPTELLSYCEVSRARWLRVGGLCFAGLTCMGGGAWSLSALRARRRRSRWTRGDISVGRRSPAAHVLAREADGDGPLYVHDARGRPLAMLWLSVALAVLGGYGLGAPTEGLLDVLVFRVLTGGLLVLGIICGIPSAWALVRRGPVLVLEAKSLWLRGLGKVEYAELAQVRLCTKDGFLFLALDVVQPRVLARAYGSWFARLGRWFGERLGHPPLAFGVWGLRPPIDHVAEHLKARGVAVVEQDMDPGSTLL